MFTRRGLKNYLNNTRTELMEAKNLVDFGNKYPPRRSLRDAVTTLINVIDGLGTHIIGLQNEIDFELREKEKEIVLERQRQKKRHKKLYGGPRPKPEAGPCTWQCIETLDVGF